MGSKKTATAVGAAFVAAGLVLAGLLAIIPADARRPIDADRIVSLGSQNGKPPPSAEEIAKPHLDWAERKSAEAIDEYVADVDSFFADAKTKTPAFTEYALGLESKAWLIADHLPFTRGGRHEAFIRSQFEELIFTPTQLSEEVERVIARYGDAIRSIEGQMLVKLRADMADFPEAFVAAELDEAQLRVRFEEALSQAIAAAGSDLRSDIAKEMVSSITAAILRKVALEIGVSAGILGAGAAASGPSLGVSLIASIIIDEIISWIWDWYADPQGALANQLNEKLDDINRLIIDGPDGEAGLRSQLEDLSRQRAQARAVALISLLQSSKGASQ